MNILGIDPGLGTTGYGVIMSANNKVELIDYGTIKTSTKDTLAQRLKIIFDNISNLIDIHKPSVFSIEEIFYSNNVKSSLLLGHARGVAMAAASIKNIMIYEYILLFQSPLLRPWSTVGIAFSDYSRIPKSQLAAVDLLRIYYKNAKKSVRN